MQSCTAILHNDIYKLWCEIILQIANQVAVQIFTFQLSDSITAAVHTDINYAQKHATEIYNCWFVIVAILLLNMEALKCWLYQLFQELFYYSEDRFIFILKREQLHEQENRESL